jgi:hypothetical protein
VRLPRLRLATLCLLVVIAALSFGIVALMKRHQDEVTQLRAELAASKNGIWRTHGGYPPAWYFSSLERTRSGGTQ